MKRLMIGVVAGLLLLGAGSYGYAEQCGCGGQMGRDGMEEGRPMPWMMHHGEGFRHGSPKGDHFLWHKLMGLGLSEQQKDALKAIRFRVIKDSIRKRADLALARVEVRELLGKEPVDMKAVEAGLKKVESARTDLKLIRIKAMVEGKAVLTPEQQKKLKEEMRAGYMMHKRHEGQCGEKHASGPSAGKDEAQRGMEAK